MRTVRSALLALLLTSLVAGQAAAAPVTVNLRVEGRSQTLLEAPVTTDGKTIDGHPCDGTGRQSDSDPVDPANPIGPTMTSALDDSGLSWSGAWGTFGIEDFFVDRVGGDTADPNSEFWAYLLDWQFAQVGGCQQRVTAGQDVLIALAGFSNQYFLRLSGSSSVREEEDYTVVVTDGVCGCPISGATVGGVTTNAAGQAVLRFQDPGTVTLKAERADSVRSNRLVVQVLANSSGATTPGITTTTPGTTGTGGTTGTTPAAGDPAAGASSFGSLDPRVVNAILRDALQRGDMRMPSSGVLRRLFVNPFSFPVTGSIALRAIGRVAPLGSARAARRSRSVRLGSAVFAAGPRETATARVRLTRAGRDLVRRGRRIVVRQSARIRDTRGSVQTVTGRFVLSAPRR